MNKEVEKSLYKIELGVLKIIPMLLALVSLLSSILYFMGIDAIFLNYIGGISLLPILLLYLSSYVFRFCEYHRMFLHYVVVIDILNTYDYYVGIPLDEGGLLTLFSIVTGIFLFIILYLYRKHKLCYKS